MDLHTEYLSCVLHGKKTLVVLFIIYLSLLFHFVTDMPFLYVANFDTKQKIGFQVGLVEISEMDYLS